MRAGRHAEERQLYSTDITFMLQEMKQKLTQDRSQATALLQQITTASHFTIANHGMCCGK